MKNSLVSVFALLFAFSSGLLFADTYVATLSGIECEGCKKTIARSLAKISGVQSIRIEKIGDDAHKMTVTTDGSSEISREQAAEAIELAEHYKIKSWDKSAEDQTEHAHDKSHSEGTPEDSWLVNGWDKIIGTWQEEDGPTVSFGWKYPGTVLESSVKWGESQKYAVMWKEPESGKIAILSLDNKGGQSKGFCTFEADKSVATETYATGDGRTGEKTTVYLLEGDTLTFQINDGEPRVLVRK
ncbi:MAG: heavy metal-associated domain-containing protein [Verrucomicrobiales bacterium]|nr:heavy metal-associated domain-containing protein [Verrucomicrobiales bacterium]